jgi:hypothetical protein
LLLHYRDGVPFDPDFPRTLSSRPFEPAKS